MPVQTRQKSGGRMVNLMEELTEDVLSDLISEQKMENLSPAAIRDIKALALNRLWPMYTTCASGRNFLKKTVVEEHVEQDIERELKAAIALVRSKPRN